MLVLHGFPDKIAALQFEWAWQHPDRSRVFRAVVGDAEAKRMQRRRGVRGKLDILRILLLYCEPFCQYELNALFLEGDHEQMFRTLLEEDGMGRGPTPLEAEVELRGREMDLPAQMSCEVRQVEQMPFWTEREDAKARKKARKERLREEKKREKKKKKAKANKSSSIDNLSGKQEEEDELSNIDDRSMVTADDDQMENADNAEVNETSSAPCCTLCSSEFTSDELPVTCASCQVQTHVLCLADKFLEDCQAPPSVLVPMDGLCPSCGNHMIWDAIMDERRQLQAERNGYYGGETVGREGGEDSDGSSVGSDGIICLTDEDEDQDGDGDEDSGTQDEGNASEMDGDSFDDIFRSDSKPAAAASAVEGSGSSDKTKKEAASDKDDCIDLITPVKGLGLADMSISDSPLSFGDELNNSDGANELGDGGEQASTPEDSSSSSLLEDGKCDDDIIDLTSP